MLRIWKENRFLQKKICEESWKQLLKRCAVASLRENKKQMELPFFDDYCLLQKSAGKGGWTFITMPVMPHLPKKKGSTIVRVRGFIDDYELQNFHVWAMKKGTFLAVKSEIRKAIQKQDGATVKLVLWLDEPQMVIPEDFLICLREEPKLLKHFENYPETIKKEITDWIFSAKTEDEKITRIAKTLEKLENEPHRNIEKG